MSILGLALRAKRDERTFRLGSGKTLLLLRLCCCLLLLLLLLPLLDAAAAASGWLDAGIEKEGGRLLSIKDLDCDCILLRSVCS